MIAYDIIATGSNGNAVLLDKRILIDCGVSYKKLKPYADRIQLVLLTHIHSDHFLPPTVRALHQERPAIRWGCCEWMVQPLLDAGVDQRVIDVLPLGHGSHYRKLATVTPEETPHNVRNCSYKMAVLDNNDGIVSIFYATDCSSLDGIRAEGYDLYFVEANHTEADISARIAAKEESGEYAYEIAAAKNHMSAEQAEAWLAENATPGRSQVIYLHQHRDRGSTGGDTSV